MLHCGPLAEYTLTQLDDESLLNSLLRLLDDTDSSSLENQMLVLLNLLDRVFVWIESNDSQDCIAELKTRGIL